MPPGGRLGGWARLVVGGRLRVSAAQTWQGACRPRPPRSTAGRLGRRRARAHRDAHAGFTDIHLRVNTPDSDSGKFPAWG